MGPWPVVILLALLRTAFCAYRAARQSIVHDEAFTYSHYVAGPWSSVYSLYDANNHVLHSILAKLSVQAFGLSEFTLRLPSVLAGFFLILGVFRLLELASTTPLVRWIALLAIGLHPLLLDFSVAARGYSVSAALLVWAMCWAWDGLYWLAGALLGLAVSANLSAAVPALALILALVVLTAGLRARVRVLAALSIPAVALSTLICYPALRSAIPGVPYFYTGDPTIAKSVFSLVVTSLHTKLEGTGLFGKDQQVRIVADFFLPAVGAFILWTAFREWRKDHTARRVIPALTLVVTVLGLIAAHVLLGLNYPGDRTGLYFVPFFGIAWALAAGGSAPRMRAVHILLAGLLTVQFTTQMQTRYFLIWNYDMDSKRIAGLLKERTSGAPPGSVSVSVTDWFQPALEFYREYLAIAPLQPIERNLPALLSGHDYYVLNAADASNAAAANLSVLYQNRITGVTVARNPIR